MNMLKWQVHLSGPVSGLGLIIFFSLFLTDMYVRYCLYALFLGLTLFLLFSTFPVSAGFLRIHCTLCSGMPSFHLMVPWESPFLVQQCYFMPVKMFILSYLKLEIGTCVF